jgi:hypothetical protein
MMASCGVVASALLVARCDWFLHGLSAKRGTDRSHCKRHDSEYTVPMAGSCWPTSETATASTVCDPAASR